MIKLLIETDGKNIHTEFIHNKTTINENSLVVRELEKIKLELLDNFEYKPQLEIISDEGEE